MAVIRPTNARKFKCSTRLYLFVLFVKQVWFNHASKLGYLGAKSRHNNIVSSNSNSVQQLVDIQMADLKTKLFDSHTKDVLEQELTVRKKNVIFGHFLTFLQNIETFKIYLGFALRIF